MSIPLQLSIPQPCSEDWDSMTSHQRFKHCQLCNKSVYPLNEYDAQEAIELIQQPSGACVKIEYNRDRQIKLRTGFSSLFLLGGLLACGTAGPSEVLQGEIESPIEISEDVLHIQPGEAVQVGTPTNGQDKDTTSMGTIEDNRTDQPVKVGKIRFVPKDIKPEDVDVQQVRPKNDPKSPPGPAGDRK